MNKSFFHGFFFFNSNQMSIIVLLRSIVTNVLFLFTSLACRQNRFHLAITHTVFEWQQKHTLSISTTHVNIARRRTKKNIFKDFFLKEKEHFTVLFRDSVFNREKKGVVLR
jgi:hypothetical protein